MNGILNESTIVKEYDFKKPDVHKIDYLLDDIIKDCRNRYFHTFEYRLVYDIKFPNISNKEKVNFTIIQRSMVFKTEFKGLSKKNQQCSKKSFYF